MKKGAERSIFDIVLGMAIVLVVLVALLWLWNRYAQAFLESSEERESLVNAIRCSYYRCVQGCSGPDIGGLIQGKSCSDFCKPKEAAASGMDNTLQDQDIKVCDVESMNNPITVSLKHDTTITKDHFEWLDGPFDYISSVSSCGPSPYGDNSIFIKEDSIKDSKGETATGGGTFKEATLRPGRYYIWTARTSYVIGKNNLIGGNTFVLDSSCFVKQGENNCESNDCCCNGKDDDGDGLIDILDNDCPRGAILQNVGKNDLCFRLKDSSPTAGVYDFGFYKCPDKLIVTDVQIEENLGLNLLHIYVDSGNFLTAVFHSELEMALTIEKTQSVRFVLSNNEKLPFDINIKSITCGLPSS